MTGISALIFSLFVACSAGAEEKNKVTRSTADVGEKKVLSCIKANTRFEIYLTGPNSARGELQINGSQQVVPMKCTRLNEKPSNLTKLWDCDELRAGEGVLMVVVDTGGFTGGTNATISRAQMFPAHPQVIQSVTCTN